jgi:hypothetical protein
LASEYGIETAWLKSMSDNGPVPARVNGPFTIVLVQFAVQSQAIVVPPVPSFR